MNERPRFLAMLAEEDRRSGASPRVEEFLRSKVRRKKRRSWLGSWKLTGWPAFAAGAAVGLGLAAFLLRPGPAAKLDGPARFVPEVPEIALVQVPPPQAPSATVLAAARPAIIRGSAPRRLTRRQPQQPELDQSQQLPRRFYEIAYAPPELLASGQIVRVKVPRAALLSFGLPLNAYRPNAGKVDADVIFTEDGIARAIRFVP